MRQLHAGDYDADSLAQLLHEASVPVMLRHPVSPSAFSWRLQSMASLLALHGDDSIEGGVYRGFTEQDRVDVSLPLRGFFPALRNGSVPAESYLFLDVSEMALAGSSRPLGDLYGRVSLLRDRGYAYAPAAARGRPVLCPNLLSQSVKESGHPSKGLGDQVKILQLTNFSAGGG